MPVSINGICEDVNNGTRIRDISPKEIEQALKDLKKADNRKKCNGILMMAAGGIAITLIVLAGTLKAKNLEPLLTNSIESLTREQALLIIGGASSGLFALMPIFFLGISELCEGRKYLEKAKTKYLESLCVGDFARDMLRIYMTTNRLGNDAVLELLKNKDSEIIRTLNLTYEKE